VLEGADGVSVLNQETGVWRPFTMRVDLEPWKDVRVRQAMRLIVDRQQMVDQVLAGNGRVANDLYSPYDPCFASELPQREQDLEQAKSLLQQAGHDGLTTEMVTSPVNGGTVEMAQVFVEQAKAAGVTVNLRRVDPGQFYGDQYLKWPFAIDFWGSLLYLPQVTQADGPGATWSETHFADPEFGGLFDEALATVDDAKRCEIIHQMQAIQHERGGYIIHYYVNVAAGYSNELLGLKPYKTGDDLNGYHLNEVSFA